MKLSLFASCAPGLEPWLADEVTQLLQRYSIAAGDSHNNPLHTNQAPTSQPPVAQTVDSVIDPPVSVPPVSVVAGGVQFSGDQQILAHALVGLGLASRVLVRIATFPVRELSTLQAHVARLPWSGWLLRGVPRVARVTCRKSRLYHSGAVEQRVLQGIAIRLNDGLGPPQLDDPRATAKRSAAHEHPEADRSPQDLAAANSQYNDDSDDDDHVSANAAADQSSPQASLVVRLDHDQCTISLDASGTPLHRRGYRLNPHQAPLREDIARALILASGWDRQQTLLDPLCGSGTLLLEAALLATGQAPGQYRSFGIEHTVLGRIKSKHESAGGKSVAEVDPIQRAVAMQRRDARVLSAKLMGNDRDPQAIQAASENAARLGITLNLQCGNLRAIETPESAVCIVSNPPWGNRIQPGARLNDVYRSLGDLRKQSPVGSTLALITSQRPLAYKTGVRLRSAFLTDAGGTKVNAFVEGGDDFLPK